MDSKSKTLTPISICSLQCQCQLRLLLLQWLKKVGWREKEMLMKNHLERRRRAENLQHILNPRSNLEWSWVGFMVGNCHSWSIHIILHCSSIYLFIFVVECHYVISIIKIGHWAPQCACVFDLYEGMPLDVIVGDC